MVAKTNAAKSVLRKVIFNASFDGKEESKSEA